jgi:hypothetical protein
LIVTPLPAREIFIKGSQGTNRVGIIQYTLSQGRDIVQRRKSRETNPMDRGRNVNNYSTRDEYFPKNGSGRLNPRLHGHAFVLFPSFQLDT